MLRIQMDAVPMAPLGFEREWAPDAEPKRAPVTETKQFALNSESFKNGGVIPGRLMDHRNLHAAIPALRSGS